VLVVGGGPAGLYTAQRLASRGVRVRVLEEHGEIGEPVHCTGIVGDEVFALPGVPADSVVGWPRAARFQSPAGHAFVCDAHDERVCVIDRGVFDRALADRAAAGAVVTTGARAVGLEVGPEAVEVTADIGSERQRFRAEVCVLATGARYRFQGALGWGGPALALGSAQTEMAADGGEHIELFFRGDTSPRGFAWLAPLSRGGESRAKVGVMAARMPASVLGRVAADLTQGGRLLGPMGPVIGRPLPLAPLSRTYGDRVLAVGDAAGLVKLTTGGGIYDNLLSAGWAADTVAAACEAGGSPRACCRRTSGRGASTSAASWRWGPGSAGSRPG
jgi:digeranylgeranylglycerophospholipid reductase